MFWIRQPGGHRHAAASGDLIGDFHRRDDTCGLERIVDAAVRQFFDFIQNFLIRRIKCMRRTQFLGKIKLIRVDIKCNDFTRPGKFGTENGIQSDAAESDNHDSAAGFDLGRVDDGTDAGDYRTAEYRHFFKWYIFIHFIDEIWKRLSRRGMHLLI